SPASGTTPPPSTLIRVDLPAPFSPTSAWISPDPISRSTSASAWTPGYALERPRMARRLTSAPARRRASALLHELRRGLSRSGRAVLGVGAALELGEEDLAVVAQLLAHPDLGRVVAGDRERLDGLEELDADLVGEGLVLRRAHDREQRGLLLGRGRDEVGAEQLVAPEVHPAQARQEGLAVAGRGLGQHGVDEAVDQRGLRPGGLGRGDDELADRDDRLVLVAVE